jgi:hypothetical protein
MKNSKGKNENSVFESDPTSDGVPARFGYSIFTNDHFLTSVWAIFLVVEEEASSPLVISRELRTKCLLGQKIYQKIALWSIWILRAMVSPLGV